MNLIDKLPDPFNAAALFRLAALEPDQQLKACRYLYRCAHTCHALKHLGLATFKDLARMIDAAEQLEVLGVFDPGRVRQDVAQWLNTHAAPDIHGDTGGWTRICERPARNRADKACRVLVIEDHHIEGKP